MAIAVHKIYAQKEFQFHCENKELLFPLYHAMTSVRLELKYEIEWFNQFNYLR